jgi:invasion protein IalB
LETLLTAPLVIEFSDTKAKEYPYSYCNKSGCVVRVGFDQSDLNDLKKGTEVTMAISHILQPDQQLILPVSLIGFMAMFNKLAAAQ